MPSEDLKKEESPTKTLNSSFYPDPYDDDDLDRRWSFKMHPDAEDFNQKYNTENTHRLTTDRLGKPTFRKNDDSYSACSSLDNY